jgi:hypothetical protein
MTMGIPNQSVTRASTIISGKAQRRRFILARVTGFGGSPWVSTVDGAGFVSSVDMARDFYGLRGSLAVQRQSDSSSESGDKNYFA